MVFQGSKARIADQIVPIIQKTIDESGAKIFLDGTVGGANVIEHIKAPTRIGMDINGDLIELYNYAIRGGKLPKTLPRRGWELAKRRALEPWHNALYEYFASYSARGFEGGYCLNNPDRDYYTERAYNFAHQLPKLQDVIFIQGDLMKLDPKKLPLTVMYFDPPYFGVKMTRYHRNFDYDSFWDQMRKLSQSHYVYVSEQTGPPDFDIVWEQQVKRNNFGADATKATERLFVYNHQYQPEEWIEIYHRLVTKSITMPEAAKALHITMDKLKIWIKRQQKEGGDKFTGYLKI